MRSSVEDSAAVGALAANDFHAKVRAVAIDRVMTDLLGACLRQFMIMMHGGGSRPTLFRRQLRTFAMVKVARTQLSAVRTESSTGAQVNMSQKRTGPAGRVCSVTAVRAPISLAPRPMLIAPYLCVRGSSCGSNRKVGAVASDVVQRPLTRWSSVRISRA